MEVLPLVTDVLGWLYPFFFVFWSLLSKILVFLLILQTCRRALLFV